MYRVRFDARPNIVDGIFNHPGIGGRLDYGTKPISNYDDRACRLNVRRSVQTAYQRGNRFRAQKFEVQSRTFAFGPRELTNIVLNESLNNLVVPLGNGGVGDLRGR